MTWTITTEPKLVQHAKPMRFLVSVADPLYVYGTAIDYGDGARAEIGDGGAVSCIPVPDSLLSDIPEPTGPAVTSTPGDSPAWTHTYARPGRYMATITVAAPCPSARDRSGTATFAFDVA
jgi:hypothetical protein